MEMTQEKPYSNREMDGFINGLHEKLDMLMKSDGSILEQVKTMSGQVNGHDAWIKGMAMCGTVFLFIVLPLAVYAYKESSLALEADILKQTEQTWKINQTQPYTPAPLSVMPSKN